MHAEQTTVGIICPPDHEVFGTVADRLRERGVAVRFLAPGEAVPPERLDALDVLVNKKVRWASLDALEYAHRAGIPAWNDYVATSVFLNRLSQVRALAAAGFAVPAVRDTKPDGDYVAKDFLDVHSEPTLNGEGDLYQPLLDFEGVDHKYYAVDDGEAVRVAAVRFRSKLFGDRECLGRGEVDPDVAASLRRLLAFTGARGLGVDVVYAEGVPHAVDANPATSFRRTGLTGALVDSVLAAVDRSAATD
jgi:hypothetical protein